MSYLNIKDFVESILDLSDSGTFPSNIMSESQTVMQILPGGADSFPVEPFLLYLTIDKTSYELSRGETVLVYKKDDTNPDLFHICRDWANYTLLAEPVEYSLDGAHSEGDTAISLNGFSPAEGDYIRIGLDPQLYRCDGAGNIEPPLNANYDDNALVRYIATQNPSSRARIHEDSEQVLMISQALSLEEIQDAIRRLQEHPFPLDLTLDTLTLNYHMKLGDLRGGTTPAGGMMKYTGADVFAYVGGEWKSLTAQGGGGGTSLIDGEEGNILAWLDGEWVPTSRIMVNANDVTISAGMAQAVLSTDGTFTVPSSRANDAEFNYLRVTDVGTASPTALNFGYTPFLSLIVAGADTAPAPIGLLGGSGDGSDGPQQSVLYTYGSWYMAAYDAPDNPDTGIIILDAQYQTGFQINNNTKAVLSASSFDLLTDTYVQGQLSIDATGHLKLNQRGDYPGTPVNGMVIYHVGAGFRGYSAGAWHDLTGSTLTFSTPGTAWSTVVYDPTADGGDGAWTYSEHLLLTPGGAVFDTAIVVGQRADLMPEQLGLLEFRNNDFMGYVLDSNGDLIRVSLTNVDVTQRLPSAANAGAIMVATGEVWGAGLLADLHWNAGSKILRADRMQIGSVGADGGAGTIRWADDQLQWNTGTSWAAFPTAASFGTPTILGAFLTALMVEDALTWQETDAILFVDDHISIPTLHVETLVLGDSELTGELFNVQNVTAAQATIATLDSTTATIGTLNVTNLNVAGAGEEDPLILKLGRLDFQAGVPNSHVFNITPTANALYVRYDETIDLAYYDFVDVESIVGAINHVGGYAIGTTTIIVDGFVESLVAGARIEIAGVTYTILHVSGAPTTQITLTTPLTTTVADNAVVTVKYGYSRYNTLGDIVGGRDLYVNRLAKFAYTIQLAAYEGGYDGELDGLPDEPGMIRYNGDFQGRLESGQWVSFTRTMADGSYTAGYGSLLWWDGTKWTKNENLTVTEDGALHLGLTGTAKPGVIRFTGTDFQGCITEGVWVSMTSLLDLPSLPTSLYEDATLRWHSGNWVVNSSLTSDGIKTNVRLLQIGSYQDFYDAGYVDHVGGYSIGAVTIAYGGFNATPVVGEFVTFSNHATVYEITWQGGNTIHIDPPLTFGVAHNQAMTIEGELARPVAAPGQVRYSQNDYEGFVENIGWVSFTGHVSQLPTRAGDPLLMPGQALYFNGLNWVAYHNMLMDANGISIFSDLDVVGELTVDGLFHASGIIVGAGQTPTRGYTTAGYAQGYSGTINVTGLPVSLGVGNRIRFTVEGTPIGQTTIYTIATITRTANVPTAITVTPALVAAIPNNASIVLVDVLDPYAYPGLIYYNDGMQRFRGFVGVVGASGEVDGEWLDLVSPIQIIPPVVQGQTLVWNDETQYWNNTPIWTLDHQDLGEAGILEGYAASTLPIKVQEWGFEGTIIDVPSGEDTLHNYKFELVCFNDTNSVQDSYLRVETLTDSGSMFSVLTDVASTNVLIVQGLSFHVSRAQFSAGIDVAQGNVHVLVGNVQLDQGDLSVLSGTVEAYRVYSDTTIWANQYVRFGYFEGVAGDIPIGAQRYSLPNNAGRGDMEFWDGEAWISMSAGFHGQAIWGAANAGQFAAFDADYEGGKWRGFNGMIANFSGGMGVSFFVTPTMLYGLDLGDLTTWELDPAVGRIAFNGSQFLGSVDGVNWLSLSHTGTSGLADGSTVGDTLVWDGDVWQPTSVLQTLSEHVKVNGVLQLKDYDDLASPPTAGAGQIRYNLNDYECYLEGHGWVSLTGHVPFQDPAAYTGQFLYSDGTHWVANDLLRVLVGTNLFGDNRDSLIWGYNATKHFVVNGQVHTTLGAHFGGAILVGASLPSWVGIPVQGYLRSQRTGDDAWLEVFAKHDGEGSASWHKIMYGDSHLISQDLGIVAYDQSLGKYVNTDLMWIERNADTPTTYQTMAVTSLDIRETLNFGNSATDENYFRWAMTGSKLKITVAEADAAVPTPSYSYGPWVESVDTSAPVTTSNDTNAMIFYHDAYYYLYQDGSVWKRVVDGLEWVQIASSTGMTQTKRFAVAVYNNYMWAIGGTDAGVVRTNKVYKSNDGITWTYVGTIPAALSYLTAVGIEGDGLYTFGGNSAGGIVHSIYHSVDGVTWTTVTYNNFPAIDHATATYYKNYFVVMGTADGGSGGSIYYSSDAINWTEVSDPVGYGSGAWNSMLLYPFADRLYILGGWDNGVAVDTIRYCTTDFADWTDAGTLVNTATFPQFAGNTMPGAFPEILFVNNATTRNGKTYTYKVTQITGLVGDYVDFDLAGNMAVWVPITFNDLVDFIDEVDFHEYAHFLSGLTVTNGGQWSASGLSVTTDVQIGTADENHILHVYGDIVVTGEVYKAAETIIVDRVMNTGLVGFGTSNLGTVRIGDVRYTGAIASKIDAGAAQGATTVHIKEVSVAVIPSVAGEVRFVVKGHVTGYAITAAVDNGGGDWTLTISPGLEAVVSVDDVTQTYVEGDWEGWTGEYWKSLTNDAESGVAFVARNQPFSAATSVTVTHGLGTYPVVQVINASGVVIVPLSITHTNVNEFVVAFSVATTGTIAW